jgi:hypothetical protein
VKLLFERVIPVMVCDWVTPMARLAETEALSAVGGAAKASPASASKAMMMRCLAAVLIGWRRS